MGFSFKNFNKKTGNVFDVDTDREYLRLSDLGNNFIFKVDGFFINPKSKFGVHAVVQADVPFPVNVSMPNGLTEVFESILKDEQAVKAVKEGSCFMKVKQYTSKKFGKVCFTAEFVDPCEPSKIDTDQVHDEKVPF